MRSRESVWSVLRREALGNVRQFLAGAFCVPCGSVREFGAFFFAELVHAEENSIANPNLLGIVNLRESGAELLILHFARRRTDLQHFRMKERSGRENKRRTAADSESG
jgi:hypothetical protein